jgi:uncharacterized membrane protein
MDVVLIVLRALHIVAGAFWIGAAFTTFGFLQPAMAKLGPDSQKFAEEVMSRRRLPMVILWSAIVAIAAGLILYWRDSGGLQLTWITSPSGVGFTIGAVAAIVAFILGPTVVLPNIAKLGVIGSRLAAEGRPPRPEEAAEMTKVQETLKLAGRVVFVLLSIAVLCMATARYW